MKQLTFKNKKLSAMEKLDIEEKKRMMVILSGNKCFVCGVTFENLNNPQMAHIVCKSKNNIKKYGYEAINHMFNIKITCSKCNSLVSLATSKKELVKKHFNAIYEDLGVVKRL